MAVAVDEFQLLLVKLAADLDIKLDRLVAAVVDRTQREVLTYISAAYPELMDRYLGAVGDLSATYYEDQPGGTPGFIAKPADPTPQARLAASARWAMLQSVPRTALSGASARFLFEHSRTTIVGNAAREDVRWARHASANACGFCRMLATRGTVYRGAATAKRSHNGCHCIAVPDRDGNYEPAPYVAQWEKDYKAARKAGASTPGQIAQAMDAGRPKAKAPRPAAKRVEGAPPAAAPGGSGPPKPPRSIPPVMGSPEDRYPDMYNGDPAPLRPSDVLALDEADLQHILAGHRYNSRVPDKREFPDRWGNSVEGPIEAGLWDRATQRTLWPGKSDRVVYIRALYDEVVFKIVLMRVSEKSGWWHVLTAHPLSGNGVTYNNPETGLRDPVPLNIEDLTRTIE